MKLHGGIQIGSSSPLFKSLSFILSYFILIKINNKWQIHNRKVKTNPCHTCNLSFTIYIYIYIYISWDTLQLAHSRVETTITLKTQGFHGPITLPHQYPSILFYFILFLNWIWLPLGEVIDWIFVWNKIYHLDGFMVLKPWFFFLAK